MRIWVWIPARGGSQSIPRKNIQLLCGHPLIEYSIRYAKSFDFVERVLVSTDDAEIASKAIEFGAELACGGLRPNALGGHYTRDEEVLSHMVRYYEDCGDVPDWWVQLRPTYPLRPVRLLRDLYERYMKNKEIGIVRTVVRSEHTPLKMYGMVGGILRPLFGEWGDVKEPYEAPRQLLPDCYWHNGCVDMIRHNIFVKYGKCFVEGEVIGHEMSEGDILDIDTWEDWKRVMNRMLDDDKGL